MKPTTSSTTSGRSSSSAGRPANAVAAITPAGAAGPATVSSADLTPPADRAGSSTAGPGTSPRPRARRSPLLSCLPRREGTLPPALVKLRRSVHRGARRPVPETFTQLTVPADYAELFPPAGDVIFEVTISGAPGEETLSYRRVR